MAGIQIKRNFQLFYKFGSSKCSELMIRKNTMSCTHLDVCKNLNVSKILKYLMSLKFINPIVLCLHKQKCVSLTAIQPIRNFPHVRVTYPTYLPKFLFFFIKFMHVYIYFVILSIFIDVPRLITRLLLLNK